MKQLHEILDLCLEINQLPGLDAFFDLQGHVNSLSIQINKDTSYGENDEPKRIYNLMFYIDDEDFHLPKEEYFDLCIKELKTIKAEYEPNNS